MKEKKKLIILIIIALVVIVITSIAVFFTQPKKEENDNKANINLTYSALEIIKIIDKSQEEMKSIKVQNTLGEYSVISLEENNYTIQGLEDVKLNDIMVSSLVNSVFQITAIKEITQYESLADFGLDEQGEATVTIKYNNDETDKLVFGLSSPSSGGTYVLKSEKVYIAELNSSYLFQSGLDFIDTKLIDIANVEETDNEGNESIASDKITHLLLTGAAFEEPIEIIENNDLTLMAPNKMILPIKADVNSSRFAEIVTQLKAVTASKAVKIIENYEDFVQYGLDKPYAQAEYTLNGESHTIKISDKNENGTHYITVDDINVIYEISSAAVSGWCDAEVMDVRASYVFTANIDEVKKLTLKHEEKLYIYEVTRKVDEEKSTEKNKKYIMNAELNSKSINYEEYQSVFSQMLGLSVFSSEKENYGAENPEYSIEIINFNEEKTEISFYKIENTERYAIKINGEYTGLIRTQELKDFF